MAKKRPIPDPPPDLSEASRVLWRGLVGDLIAVGDGAEIDCILLANTLRAQDRLDAIRAEIASEGLVVTGSKGQKRSNPLLREEQALARDVAAGFERLELTPNKRGTYVEVTSKGRLKRTPDY